MRFSFLACVLTLACLFPSVASARSPFAGRAMFSGTSGFNRPMFSQPVVVQRQPWMGPRFDPYWGARLSPFLPPNGYGYGWGGGFGPGFGVAPVFVPYYVPQFPTQPLFIGSNVYFPRGW